MKAVLAPATIACSVVFACNVFEEPLPLTPGGTGATRSGDGGERDSGGSGAATTSGGTSQGGGAGGATGDGGSGATSSDSGGTDGNGGTGGDEPVSTGGAPETGGAPSTEPFWIVENEHGCQSVRPPKKSQRPAVSDPGEDLSPIVLAISKTRHGVTKDEPAQTPDLEAWRSIGFDLDGVCSNTSACEVGGSRVQDFDCANAASTPFDGDGCRDNAIGRLFVVGQNSPAIGALFGLTEADWNCELHRGGFSTLIKIKNYNGKLNDRDVRVDLYTSTGLQSLPGWTCRSRIDQPLAADWFNYAAWLSNAHWKISRRSIDLAAPPTETELPNAVVNDGTAYVRNGYLVAYLPEGSEFQWNGQNTPVPGFRDVLRSPVLVAPLRRDPDTLEWSIKNGTLAGAILPGDMLRGFQEIGVCENMCNTFITIRNYLNSNQDLLAHDFESPLPDSPCGGLSWAIDFDAKAATATRDDIVETNPPDACPEPRHPAVGRQGCVCQADGTTCINPADGGS